jgi:thiol-disulfide isomerase/thioredoxin
MMYRSTVAVLILAAGATLAVATEPTLKIGNPAPNLQTGKWVQGEPVTGFEKGKVYVVEFWATWCRSCRGLAPHLSEIQNKYKNAGLILIGQDCYESNERRVAPFVKRMGDKMTYRIALDDKTRNEKGAMLETWMTAAGKERVPTVFLVDTKGVIAWIGHPLQLKQKVIEEVLAGKFDLKQAAEEYDRQQKDAAQVQREMTNIDYLVGHDRNYTAAYKLADRLSESHKNDIMLQTKLATQIWRFKQLDRRGLAVLETIATRAADAATDGGDAYVLGSLARMVFNKGLKEKAIELEEKAILLADDREKATCLESLAEFKKGGLK